MDPGKLVKKMIHREFQTIWTSLPGVIQKVHHDEMKVDVYFKVKWSDDPIHIKKVRLLYPQSSTSKILFEVNPGDTVLLTFTKHAIITLQQKGILVVNANDIFDKKDVVAIPGFTLDSEINDDIMGVTGGIPEGVTITTDKDVVVTADEFRYNDGQESYRVLTTKDVPEHETGIQYIIQEQEPVLESGTTAIWTKTNEYDEPIAMYLVSKTEVGQKLVELG